MTSSVPAAADEVPTTLPESTTTTTTTAPTTTVPTTTVPTTTPVETTTTVETTTSTATGPSDPATTTTGAAGTTSTTVPGLGRAVGEGTIVPESSTELDQEEIESLLALQHQYDELVADESATLAEYTIRLTRVEHLDAELALADVELDATELELERAVVRVRTLEREQRANIAARQRTSRELDDARAQLGRQAVDAFVVGGNASDRAWSAVLDADSASSAGIVMVYADVILDQQTTTIEGVEELEDELAATSIVIAEAQTEADNARKDIEELERELAAKRGGLQDERDRAEAERVALDAALTAIRNSKAEYDRRLQTMAVESDNITSVLNRAQRDQERDGSLMLLRGPLDPTRVTSNFGPRMHPIFNTLRRHNGVDLAGPFGAPIRAVDDGIVVMAESRNGFGNTIVIDHGGRIASLYAHQSRFEVGVGDVVQRGEVIGRVGSTGWSTGPHLHLEMRLEGIAVDPAGYLVRDEPLDCALLLASDHAIDQTVLAGRPDC